MLPGLGKHRRPYQSLTALPSQFSLVHNMRVVLFDPFLRADTLMDMDKEHLLGGTKMQKGMARYTHMCYPLFTIYYIPRIVLSHI